MSKYTESEIECAARTAHEVNRAFCREMLGDNSHLMWKDVPERTRAAVYRGVMVIADDPDISPAGSHETWRQALIEDGWVEGPVKDPVARTHPCLIPFSQLPMVERIKDALFAIVVRAALGIDCHVAVDVPRVGP